MYACMHNIRKMLEVVLQRDLETWKPSPNPNPNPNPSPNPIPNPNPNPNPTPSLSLQLSPDGAKDGADHVE